MTNARAALATLLILLGLVGLPIWAYLTVDTRQQAAQIGPVAPVPQLGPAKPNPG